MHYTLPILAFASLASAHFRLQWPATGGSFDEDQEDEGPCGGQNVTVSSSSPKLDVSRFSVAIRNGHPTGSFEFYATTDTAAPYNFTQIAANIDSAGVGVFCSSELYAPSSFAGRGGILQVVVDSDDGTLYQCAPVNFVSSSGDVPDQSTCYNGTATRITWAASNDTSSAITSSSTSNTVASATVAATSSTRTGAAPAMTMCAGMMVGVGMVAAGILI